MSRNRTQVKTQHDRPSFAINERVIIVFTRCLINRKFRLSFRRWQGTFHDKFHFLFVLRFQNLFEFQLPLLSSFVRVLNTVLTPLPLHPAIATIAFFASHSTIYWPGCISTSAKISLIYPSPFAWFQSRDSADDSDIAEAAKF